jgi:hypothetical protein
MSQEDHTPQINPELDALPPVWGGVTDSNLIQGNVANPEFTLYAEVHGPHNLEPHPDKLYTFVDKTAEAVYLDLVKKWDERAAMLHASPEQTPTMTNEGLGLHYPKVSLYHGGGTTGITEFMAAKDDTVGHGLYATSMPDQAFGYAVVRADSRKKVGDTIFVSGSSPVVYEVEVTEVDFLDLRKAKNIGRVMEDYADYLDKWLEAQRQQEDLSWLKRSYLGIVTEKIKTIRQSENHIPPSLKEILQQTGSIFTEFVTGRGYDGVVALEGGEGGYTGNHDSWVIMEPSRAKVTNELVFLSPDVSDVDAWKIQRTKTNKLFGNAPVPPPRGCK